MRIDSNFSSLQAIQAQQAFKAKTRPIENQEVQQPLQPQLNSVSLNTGMSASQIQKAGIPVNDIQKIAQKAGYLDVNPVDIQRAYLRGESLLVDYRV
jgi:hypothetical protein